MMFKYTTVACLAVALVAMASSTTVLADNTDKEQNQNALRRATADAKVYDNVFHAANMDDFPTGNRHLSSKSSKSSSSSRSRQEVKITITNLTFKQPFGGIFVMVHEDRVAPLFTLGKPSSAALAVLAESGSPAALVAEYNGDRGVLSAEAVPGPIVPGASAEITVTMRGRAQYVTIATMAINTNDCFVALNGAKVQPGDSFRGVGYDSGSEINNQNCSSIPGPACAAISADNQIDENGEGYVHVHRGVQTGFGDLPAPQDLDWRNPMVMFSVSSA